MVRLDLDDFRTILDTAGVDVWTFIDTAMEVASLDYGNQLKDRRDGIVERLYALTSPPSRCRNCDTDRHHDGKPNGCEIKQSSPQPKRASPQTPQSADGDGVDPYGGLFDDEQKRVLEIKEQLEIPHQPEDALVELLQSLADMDITFQALKETDIGRHVNRLRKHSSNDVRRLVKHLVRKWKDIVDEWVRLNQPGEQTSTLIADGDSPQQKVPQNGYHQVPDFAYSPNPHSECTNGSSGSDRNTSEPEPKGKPIPKQQPMGVYSTLWEADDWATRGGQEKIDWKKAPFFAYYKDFDIEGCPVPGPAECPSNPNNWWEGAAHQALTPLQARNYRWVRVNHMIYDYCVDKSRYPVTPPECVAGI